MNATNPIEIEGKIHDRYSLCMSIAGNYTPGGSMTGNVALRLVPVRIAPDGTVETAAEGSVSLAAADFANHADPHIRAAATAILAALQTLVTSKQL
jgi:hypothetical protein